MEDKKLWKEQGDSERYKEKARELLKFIEKSPSCFHLVAHMKRRLSQSGFQEIKEDEEWTLREGGKYFVTRNGSSLIAFKIPGRGFQGFRIMASHSDSPAFKVKENAQMEAGGYSRLNVERYGGMIYSSWFDRPLSVAGRVVLKEGGRIRWKLVDVGRDLLLIPNLAIHLNREVNDGYKYNAQTDMLPLLGNEMDEGCFMEMIAGAAGAKREEIIGTDLFLYNRQKGTIWGADEAFISSPKLDDLECVFASLEGLLGSDTDEDVSVHCVFDNEEVGSGTKQGAASAFLKDTLMRINRGMERREEEYYTALARSFMISADNAHAVHPNKSEKADPTNRPCLNGGVVIKYSANQKYTTDAVSGAAVKLLCEKAGIPVQTYINRSDMVGGSTLGNISNTQVALNTADVGAAQLAMHSSYETGGVRDVLHLVKFAQMFLGGGLRFIGEGSFEVRGGIL